MSNKVEELPEDIEVIGPGQMLAEAREKLGLSQKAVAAKLNFRVALVDEIEHEVFDKTLPDTFNRGYLKNYAKLVGVAEKDVLASYEMLGVADKQRTEMQSFSKITEKQAQNSRLMWVTYLILAGLVASSILYYWQDMPASEVVKPLNTTALTGQNSDSQKRTQGTQNESQEPTAELTNQHEQPFDQPLVKQSESPNQSNDNLDTQTELDAQKNIIENQAPEPLANEELVPEEPQESVAIFTFAGDCWVNIYDGNNERIAWGIKKAGYVMELKGIAPFKVTVGKPELVAINFNGESIDMSKFNLGNIAKFTLPESP